MKASIFFLVLASASAAPQFEGLKNIFSALSGDDEPGEVNGDYEQVPYTTLKKFDGYEMRQYPSVKWVCTDVTYKMEKEDSLSRDTNDFNLIKMVQEMMSGKGWKNKPENKMFMKLFRYISGVNKEQEEEEVEEQAREQNVHETVQVHLWGEQGAGGGGDDCPSPKQDEVAGGRDGEQADVLLPQQEAPGQPADPHRPRREDRAEQGVHSVCAQLRRLCHERLCQPEGGEEICRGAEQRRGGGRQ